MITPLQNTPRDYAWGSVDLIPALLGTEPTGEPQAEIWYGAHPEWPATTGSGERFDAWLAADPSSRLGDVSVAGHGEPGLPFLLKLLAAGEPLSIQAHPDLEGARAGFAAEEAAGIPSASPERTYRDRLHKPEVIVAVGDRFDALAGFREPEESAAAFGRLAGLLGHAPGLLALAGRLNGLTGPAQRLRDTVATVLARADETDAALAEIATLAATDADDPDLATARLLAAAHPDDPGILVGLLMNRAELSPGEALFVDAGVVHAYLGGLGVELMAASDNVLRGGLTKKHVDVAALQEVLDFRPSVPPLLVPASPAAGVHVYAPGLPDFALVRLEVTELTGLAPITGPAIALCVRGRCTLTGSDVAELAPGDAVYLGPDENAPMLSGDATVYVATVGAR